MPSDLAYRANGAVVLPMLLLNESHYARIVSIKKYLVLQTRLQSLPIARDVIRDFCFTHFLLVRPYEKHFMTLASLVYVSNACYEMSDNDLLNILETARKSNKARNITGLLLYRDGFFIQALEGDFDKIGELFEHICQDRRHANIVKLYHEPIEARKFSQWAMGFASPDFMKLKEIPGFSDFMQPESIKLTRQAAIEIEDYIEGVLERFRQPVVSE